MGTTYKRKARKELVAGWSFTNRCNLACKHCYNNSGVPKPNELTLKESVDVAKKLLDAGVTAINFGGGECTLRDDFIPLCEILYNMGLKLSLTTNGTRMKKVLDNVELFNDIGISLDFAERQMHNEFRGSPKAFDSALDAVTNVGHSGVETEVVTCLTKMNCSLDNLKAMDDLLSAYPVNAWRFNRYRTTGREEMIRELTLSPEDLKRAYIYIKSRMGQNFRYSTPEPLFSLLGGVFVEAGCPCGITSFRIHSDGEVSPCIYMQASGGNIKEKSVEEIMNSELFRSFVSAPLPEKCQACPVSDVCRGGCKGATYAAYGKFDLPDPLCWWKGETLEEKPRFKTTGTWNVHERYLCTAYIERNPKNEHAR